MHVRNNWHYSCIYRWRSPLPDGHLFIYLFSWPELTSNVWESVENIGLAVISRISKRLNGANMLRGFFFFLSQFPHSIFQNICGLMFMPVGITLFQALWSCNSSADNNNIQHILSTYFVPSTVVRSLNI